MTFARRLYLIAGIYGILVISPLLFLEQRFGIDHPPPVTHPEFYYGFAFLGLVYQGLFILISRDPIRYRPLMILAVLEKLPYGLTALVLHHQGRLSTTGVVFGVIDLALGALFLAAYRQTASPTSS